MSTFNRRDLLRGGIAAGVLGLASSCSKTSSSPAKPAPVVVKKKRILILGGTGFLGPKTIDAAIARGHTVTIFNRGKREKFLPLTQKVEHLYGNRDPELPADDEKGPDGKLLHPTGTPKGLEQLAGKQWDVVIDNSGYFPRMVKASAELLSKNASRYIFISSISAYDEKSTPATGGDETVKLATMADPTVETMGDQFQNYGPLKVLCEQAAEAAFPGRTAIVRPGYIVGPGDPTDRFTYWPVRIAAGGELLAPGSPDDPLQWIDVRDLAEWLITMVENETTGVFNAIGPSKPARWGDVLASCVRAAGPKAAKLEWVPTEWLEANEMAGEDSFPIWIPPKDKYAGFHRWGNDSAEATGLRFRTMDDTAKAILDWYPTEIERRHLHSAHVAEENKAKGKEPPKGDPGALRAGPKRDREVALLEKWKARTPK
ncbi:MAG: NAD-dependent epimerase/dehydratase family protein [Myxococcota bacterium]|nr:NAD-dependent epimerase/dehydratase family protein [Myxococcota bacterium]